ncbi:MAG: HAMP domain-containing histidine kinase [Saprospiraceae bacterium]|nr:HAMP domain-containing histidine kinase [Saprospiraceae bacterium]
MSKKVIWAIIIIMSTSLVGVGMIQLFWIKWSVNLDEKNFNDKVITALNRVKDRLRQDVEDRAYSELLKQRTETSLSSGKEMDSPFKPERTKDMNSLSFFLNPSEYLEAIDKDKLDLFLRQELADQGIDLKYEYGVYSNELHSYIIVNGNYAVSIEDTTKSSNVAELSPLLKAEYRISLFANEFSEPGHLNLYFPNKTRFLWSSVFPILLSSTLFTVLILFCFSYTVYIIFRQKKVSEMKTDFINNMTHEFKTPIATISLASDSVLSPSIIHDENKVRRFINIIKQENLRMLSQVEKVLQMGQIERNDLNLKFGELDIHELIEDAVVNAGLKVQAKGGSIHADLRAKDPVILADHTHIGSVINNLLDNAEKYTPEKPEITISTSDVSNGIQISVKDNGIGIPKDAQKHIFEKFYRVPTGNVHNVKGFGLGLSYVKAMVEAHGGHIQVKSEPGKGSTFTVFLPKKQKTK